MQYASKRSSAPCCRAPVAPPLTKVPHLSASHALVPICRHHCPRSGLPDFLGRALVHVASRIPPNPAGRAPEGPGTRHVGGESA